MAATSPFDPPRRDRFEETVELGRGGMGRVFEALDTALDRPVAIKQSLVDDDEIQARFEREVRITAKLQHPSIVPVLDAGRDEKGRPFYVMRKIEGRPLADLVAEATSVRDRLALVPRFLAAVDATAYAHARGVIHRDIKPWNVLLGPFGETLLIDWGLARELSDTREEAPVRPSEPSTEALTRAGAAYGTPGFMAPEQARGETLDRRADVYALGATLYHVLAGVRPFAEIASTRAIEVAAVGTLPDLAQIPKEVPAELTAIVTKAMAPARADRYPDANALDEDLRRFLSGQLVAAHEYTALELLGRWLRRHRIAVAIAGIATVLLVVVALLFVRSIIRERDRADEARAAQAVRADELLVERADAIVTQDPARALALLKQLPANSAAWDRAQSVAETAQFFGVGWGRTVDIIPDDAKPARLVASPDGARVALLAIDKIFLVDPALHTPPKLLLEMDLSDSKVAVWTNSTSLVVPNHAGELVRIDVPSGATHRLDAGGSVDRVLPPMPDGVLVVLGGGKLRKIDLDGGAPTPIAAAGPVLRAERIADGTAYATASELWIHRDNGVTHKLRTGDGVGTFQVSIGGFVAVVGDGEVIEWNVAVQPPVERNRWETRVGGLSYSIYDLIGFDQNTATWLQHGGGVAPDMRGTYYSTVDAINLLLSSGPRGLVFSMPGSLRFFVTGRSLAIGGRAESLLSADQAGRYLLGISATGVLRSWNLDEVIPKVLADEGGAKPIGMNDRIVWLRQIHDRHLVLARLDEKYEFENSSDVGEVDRRCYGPGRDVLTSNEAGAITRVELIDHERQERATIEGHLLGVACSTDAAVVALLAVDKITVLDVRAGIQRRFEIPITRALRQVAVSGNFLAIVDEDGVLSRIDYQTSARVVTQIEPVGQLAVEETGRVSFQRNGVVYLWSGSGAPVVTITARAVHAILPTVAGLVVITDANTIALVDPKGSVRSYQTGSRTPPSVARALPFVVITDLDQNLAILDLRNGSLRHLPWWADQATLGSDARSVFGLFGRYAVLSVSTVPRDRAGLREWVKTATNATLEPGSTTLTWE